MWTIFALGPEPEAAAISPWITAVVVPALTAIVTTSLTVGLGILAIHRSEWYRRLSRWEPFAEMLWQKQAELYIEICDAAKLAYQFGVAAALHTRSGKNVTEHALYPRYLENMELVESKQASRSILLSSDFNAVYEEFYQGLLKCVHIPIQDPDDWDNEQKQTLQRMVEMINCARKSLGINALDKNAGDALLGSLQKELETKGSPIDAHTG